MTPYHINDIIVVSNYGGSKMVTIRKIKNIEELEAERERQRSVWICDDKKECDFYLNLESRPFKYTDLTNAYLNKANFIRCNLSCVDFKGSKLKGSDFMFSDLTFADLIDCDLMKADFYKATLIHANLSGADLRGAYLTKANLTMANLTRAKLNGASLIKANLSGADLRGADLDGANFKYAIIKDTIITPSQYDELSMMYSLDLMDGFVIKELEEWQH